MKLIVASFVVLLLGACLETPAVQCADGRVCPAGRACDDVHGGCVLPGQIEECAGRPDETACAYQGEPDGACFDGVCFPAGCGNGELEEGEACDDGNTNNGDGCSADCTSDEICGNGIIDFLTEGCDDGNTDDGDGCQGNCIPSTCGDGVVDLEFNEACDEGPDNSNDPDATCRLNCQPRRCADGIVDSAAGENCDDGNLFPGDGCSGACVVEECGNGVIDLAEVGGSFLPSEECDDGENGLNHDGCATSCLREAPTWAGPPPVLPSPRTDHAMAYDAARGKVVLFSGIDGGRPDDTWEYDDQTQTWIQVPVASPDAPSSRAQHAMAYDTARGKVVLFGGLDETLQLNGETWEYDGRAQGWTQAPAASSDAPSARQRHAMVYDAARGKVVLFGGIDDAGINGETWEYDGATQTWTEVLVASPEAPSPRQNHAMAYDAGRGKVVLFGGFDGASNGETWEYDGQAQSWTQVPVASPDAPTPRSLHTMAYDAARGKIVLFGGFDGANNGETWEYDSQAESWTQVPVASPDAPTPRRLHAMAYDALRGKIVLFGGFDGANNGETWEYDGQAQSWTRLPMTSPAAPSPRDQHAMAYDAAHGKVVLFGGVDGATDGETWEYDGGTQTWTQVPVTSPDAPSPRRGHAMAYDAARGKVVLFGGQTCCSLANETWEYDGATRTWTQVPVANAPSPRFQHAMTYDAARGKVVLFGGIDDAGRNGETWEYDGATQSWTQVPVTSPDAPSPRSSHAMAYDAVHSKVVLFGGSDGPSNPNSETWEYDSRTQSWTRVPVASSPRESHAMSYDAARGKVLLFGGRNNGGTDGVTLEYDSPSQSWTQVSVASPNAPSPRLRHGMAYDAARRMVVLFGGTADGDKDAETWTFQHSTGIADACTTGFDGDADGLVGCDDPDCWGRCTPHCPVNSTPLWPTDCDTAKPHCGDGVCNPFLETPRLCPGDCGPPAAICGDFHCDNPEDDATCPGDCTP